MSWSRSDRKRESPVFWLRCSASSSSQRSASALKQSSTTLCCSRPIRSQIPFAPRRLVLPDPLVEPRRGHRRFRLCGTAGHPRRIFGIHAHESMATHPGPGRPRRHPSRTAHAAPSTAERNHGTPLSSGASALPRQLSHVRLPMASPGDRPAHRRPAAVTAAARSRHRCLVAEPSDLRHRRPARRVGDFDGHEAVGEPTSGPSPRRPSDAVTVTAVALLVVQSLAISSYGLDLPLAVLGLACTALAVVLTGGQLLCPPARQDRITGGRDATIAEVGPPIPDRWAGRSVPPRCR